MTDPNAPANTPDERVPFWGYRDILMLGGLAFLLFIVVGMISQLLRSEGPVTAAEALTVTFVLEGLCFALLFGLIRFGYRRPFWRSIGWLPTHYGFWPCLGWGVLTAALLIGLGSVLPRPPLHNLMEELLKDRSSILLVGVFAVTLGPLFEELAFRGFLMPLLTRTFGAVAAVVLQAVPFALLHGSEYAWAWQQMILMFLAGAAFGWMRYKSGSTAASTCMHAGYNLVAFAGMLAQSFAAQGASI
jgi:membrane protease YdiL (CAAX protease family)